MLSPSQATQFVQAPLRLPAPPYTPSQTYQPGVGPIQHRTPYTTPSGYQSYRPPQGRKLPQPYYDRAASDQYQGMVDDYPGHRQISPTHSTGSTSPRRLTLRRQDRVRGSAESIVGKVRIARVNVECSTALVRVRFFLQ